MLEHSFVFGNERDYLNVSDQFRPHDPADGEGTQRHFASGSFEVFYGNTSDRISPLISDVNSTFAAGTANIAVRVSRSLEPGRRGRCPRERRDVALRSVDAVERPDALDGLDRQPRPESGDLRRGDRRHERLLQREQRLELHVRPGRPTGAAARHPQLAVRDVLPGLVGERELLVRRRIPGGRPVQCDASRVPAPERRADRYLDAGPAHHRASRPSTRRGRRRDAPAHLQWSRPSSTGSLFGSLTVKSGACHPGGKVCDDHGRPAGHVLTRIVLGRVPPPRRPRALCGFDLRVDGARSSNGPSSAATLRGRRRLPINWPARSPSGESKA